MATQIVVFFKRASLGLTRGKAGLQSVLLLLVCAPWALAQRSQRHARSMAL